MAHIPDGFLSASVAGATFAAAGALTVYAARRTRARLDQRAAPTLGLATAAVFVAQAVNFPVLAGTSGHLLGGVLLAVLFGPWAAFLVMTAVLIAQAVIFADGGLTALGANVVNIAGVGTLVGYACYRMLITLAGWGPVRRSLSAAVAGFLATVLTGTAAGLELGLSGVAPVHLAVSAMAGVHAVIGMAEGAITGFAVGAVASRRPDLLTEREPGSVMGRTGVLAGLGALAVVGGLLAIVASAAPDGLERVAIELGFAGTAKGWQGAPLGDYRAWFPGPLGVGLAVVLGVALVFAGAAAMARAVARPRTSRRG